MHLCYDTLPVPYVPVRVTRGAMIAHRYNYEPPRCRTSQSCRTSHCCKTSLYCRTFIPISVFLWNELADPVFASVCLAGFNSRDNPFFISLSCSLLFVFYCISFFFIQFYRLELWHCRGLWTDRV